MAIIAGFNQAGASHTLTIGCRLRPLRAYHQNAGMPTQHETRDTVPLTSLPPCIFTLYSVMLPVVQNRKDKEMAEPASSVLNSDATHLLQLTCITPQKQRQSTRQATTPSTDIRNIRITQSRPQWYIGRRDKEYEPASNNAYFTSEAVEHNHALITLNDKGELYVLDISALGGVLINGDELPKGILTPLPSSSEIVLTRSWNPVTSSWTHKLALKAIVRLASPALSSTENSSTSCAQRQSLLNDYALTESGRSLDTAPTTPCGRKSHSRGFQKESRISRGARKRLHNETESDDDTSPSRPVKSPCLASPPDIHRWQECVHDGPWSDICSTHSEQDHSTSPLQTLLQDHLLTRSRSSTSLSSNGPPTPTPEPEKSQCPIIWSKAKMKRAICIVVELLIEGPKRPEDVAIYQDIRAMV